MAGLLLERGISAESTTRTPEGDEVNSVWYAAARGRNRKLVEFLVRRGATPLGLRGGLV